MVVEKKNMDQETKHARMIVTLDKVVDRQENQLRFQRKKFQQEVRYMKEEMMEVGVVQLREQEMEHRLEVKDLKEREEKNVKEIEVGELRGLENMKATKEAGVQTAERLEVQQDAKVARKQMWLQKEAKVQAWGPGRLV